MTENICRYAGDREQAIVSYLYGDSSETDFAERALFEEHLSTCDRCGSEVAAFEGVRASLGRWAPPRLRSEDLPSYAAVGDQPPLWPPSGGAIGLKPDPTALESRWRAVPAWAQAVAAVLVLGVTAGIANLDIQYDASGLRVRTGWIAPAPAPATIAADNQPWREELTALEQRLRSDLRPLTSTNAADAVRSPGPEVIRRIRTLVEESERRQQRELALRLGEAMREVSVQRQEDLVRIDRNIGAMQSNTGREMLRQRSDLLNYVTVRTAARPQ
jgi:hypothetical protein